MKNNQGKGDAETEELDLRPEMGTPMTGRNDHSNYACDWNRAKQMVEEGRYDKFAEILDKASDSSRQSGNSLASEILAAARQICLACDQSRSEMNWHRQAEEEALVRERELKHQLFSLLNAISNDAGGESSNPPSGSAQSRDEKSGSRSQEPTFWKRLNKIVEWRRPADEESDIASTGAQTPVTGNAMTSSESEPAMPALSIRCLGQFRVFRDDHLIGNWTSIKGQSILKFLAKNHRAPIAKEILMDLFWPEADAESARRNLHQAIYSLRQTLKRGLADFQPILFENDCYSFNSQITLSLDFEEFEQRVQHARRLESAGRKAEAMIEFAAAEEIYLGDFLEEDIYEEWSTAPREQLRQTYLHIADRLSEHYRQGGDYGASIDLCQKIIAKDNCNELAHRRLMQCYESQGQRGLAARQYNMCVDILKKELDVSPSSETQNLFNKIIGYSKGMSAMISGAH